MRPNILVPALVALVITNTATSIIPPPPAYPPAIQSSLPEASDIMHASSSSKCSTLTTTLTLTLTKTIPVLSVTPSQSTVSETGIPEPSSYSPVSPLPPSQPSLPYSNLPSSDVPSSVKTQDSTAPTTLAVTTAIPEHEPSEVSSALAASSPSAVPITSTSISDVVSSEETSRHASHAPVQSASSKPVGVSATTVVMSLFSGTGSVTRTDTVTGTGSYRPSSTLPFADAADAIGVPGVVVGVMAWAVLML